MWKRDKVRTGRLARLLAVGALASVALRVSAQPVRMVHDINAGPPTPQPSYPNDFVPWGSGAMFTAFDASGWTGEVWTTDGTSAGTQRVPTLTDFHLVGLLHRYGSVALALGQDDSYGGELWSFDGTAQGERLIADIHPGPMDGFPVGFVDMGGVVYFIADGTNSGVISELWRTDGTGPGTRRVGTCSASLSLLALGSRVLFAGSGATVSDDELWASDGTDSGTQLVRDIAASSSSEPAGLTALGSVAVFSADDYTSGREPWVTDGTGSGTQLLADCNPGPASSNPDSFTAVGSLLYFAADDGQDGRELWVTDGTPTGTHLVKDINPGAAGSMPVSLASVGGVLFFAADDGVHGPELWTSDGTSLGTRLVADIQPGAGGSSPMYIVETPWGMSFFADDGVHGLEPWAAAADGTSPRLLDDVYPGLEAGALWDRPLTLVNGLLYFAGCTPSSGCEPWVTDGTTAGTHLLVDIAATTSPSNPSTLVSTGSFVHFSADDGVHGPEPWVSDGSDSGTRLTVDLVPGASGSSPTFLATLGTRVVFSATDASSNLAMWSLASDGSDLQRLASIPYFDGTGVQLLVHGTLGLFAGSDPATGSEPWVTDGTTAGTHLLADLVAGSADSAPHGFAPTPNGAVFYVNDASATFGHALFGTDFSAAGTQPITGAFVVAYDSATVCLPARGGALFTGYDNADGYEPWFTDGTSAGTHLLADVVPGTSSSWLIDAAPVVGGTLLTMDGGAGLEPWFTDSSNVGVQSLGDLAAGSADSIPRFAIDLGTFTLFIANDCSTGYELWRTDGTSTGTSKVGDFFPGFNGSYPHSFLRLAPGLAIFAANDGVSGMEPWITDGTAAGTRMLADVCPGSCGSRPHDFARAGNAVLFSADDGTGEELWALDVTPEAGNCSNGQDDDWDGLTDCADPDCATDPACQGADLDGDGVPNSSDCAPRDASAFALPVEELGLRVTRSAATGNAVLGWTSQTLTAGNGTAWDVASKALTTLGDGTPWPCAASRAAGTSWEDPATGSTAYLVRAINSCGNSGWGSGDRAAPHATSCP